MESLSLRGLRRPYRLGYGPGRDDASCDDVRQVPRQSPAAAAHHSGRPVCSAPARRLTPRPPPSSPGTARASTSSARARGARPFPRRAPRARGDAARSAFCPARVRVCGGARGRGGCRNTHGGATGGVGAGRPPREVPENAWGARRVGSGLRAARGDARPRPGQHQRSVAAALKAAGSQTALEANPFGSVVQDPSPPQDSPPRRRAVRCPAPTSSSARGRRTSKAAETTTISNLAPHPSLTSSTSSTLGASTALPMRSSRSLETATPPSDI